MYFTRGYSENREEQASEWSLYQCNTENLFSHNGLEIAANKTGEDSPCDSCFQKI
jgi:hypothetical protein